MKAKRTCTHCLYQSHHSHLSLRLPLTTCFKEMLSAQENLHAAWLPHLITLVNKQYLTDIYSALQVTSYSS